MLQELLCELSRSKFHCSFLFFSFPIFYFNLSNCMKDKPLLGFWLQILKQIMTFLVNFSFSNLTLNWKWNKRVIHGLNWCVTVGIGMQPWCWSRSFEPWCRQQHFSSLQVRIRWDQVAEGDPEMSLNAPENTVYKVTEKLSNTITCQVCEGPHTKSKYTHKTLKLEYSTEMHTKQAFKKV